MISRGLYRQPIRGAILNCQLSSHMILGCTVCISSPRGRASCSRSHTSAGVSANVYCVYVRRGWHSMAAARGVTKRLIRGNFPGPRIETSWLAQNTRKLPTSESIIVHKRAAAQWQLVAHVLCALYVAGAAAAGAGESTGRDTFVCLFPRSTDTTTS